MKAEWGIYKKPYLMWQINFIKKHIYQKVKEMNVYIYKTDEPVEFEDINKINCRRIKRGEAWGKAFSCAWFNIKGEIPDSIINSHIVLLADIGGEGLYYNNLMESIGSINSKITFMDYLQPTWDTRVIELDEKIKKNGSVNLWIDAGFNGKIIQPFGKARFKYAYLSICRDDIKDLYFDYITLSFALCSCENKKLYKEIKLILEQTWKALKGFSRENVAKASQIIKKMYELKGEQTNIKITAVGQGHLDLAWLWPIRETKRKALRTLLNSLQNIQNYPDYIFGMSQPQLFEWLKIEKPLIYNKIKEKVEKGNIELQGGMWVECDTNLPGGEALIRQIYYGKSFFKNEFNKDIKICWLPDAFGFNGNLPQILKKAGIDYFLTIKLAWNEYNKFPYTTFNWIGIDGSSILVHMPPEGDYTSAATALCIKRTIDNFIEKDRYDNALLIYGNGDGGGGPTQTHIEMIKREQRLQFIPEIRFGRAIEFFERLNKANVNLPSYKGELYLEKHQGTYTSQSRIKKYNRQIEFLLHNLEYLATYAYLKGYEYPHAFLDKIWKEVLLYQFHDILPGSSISRVYSEAIEGYKKIQDQIKDKIDDIINFFEPEISRRSTLINTTNFKRKEYFKVDNKWFYCEVDGYSSANLEIISEKYDLNYGQDYIQNEYFRVCFGKEGYISSVYDIENKKEFCSEYLNRLVLYKDPFKFYNAWDIDINYTKKRKIYLKIIGFQTFIDGPKVVRRNYYRYKKTTIKQDVILYSMKLYIEFDTECDFQQRFKMLRADFSPAIFSEKVLCDIQFGYVERSTNNKSKIEKAQYEVCAHKWININDGEYGIALINDSKYGHRIKEGMISLNLLRSPVYPDPQTDRGMHNFRYLLYPYKGSFKDSEVIKYAYLFNVNPIITDRNINLKPLLKINKENVIIETIKKAEKEEGIIIRLYEILGEKTVIYLNYGFQFKELYEVDLMENKIQKIDGNSIEFSGFEIKTYLFII